MMEQVNKIQPTRKKATKKNPLLMEITSYSLSLSIHYYISQQCVSYKHNPIMNEWLYRIQIQAEIIFWWNRPILWLICSVIPSFIFFLPSKCSISSLSLSSFKYNYFSEKYVKNRKNESSEDGTSWKQTEF